MKIGIIGCGNMGQALLRGIIAKGYISKGNILVSDKDRKKAKLARLRFKVGVSGSNSELIKKCGVIICAIKPQDVDAVLQDALLPLEGKLLISICAGLTTRRLEKRLGRVSVVRVMPNMPALVSLGISAISSGKYATARDKKVAVSIFSCIGEVVEVKEQLMDAVTAISGSGPAYFFYLVQKLIEAAKELGIPGHIARRLATKTALGSAVLMNQCKASPQILRKQVSSKGGTTEAAFNVFRKKGLDKILVLAFKAAAKRSKEMGERG
ncbi:MAG: pyrroline-5-carboxylate reductase [Candidatus Omnitrophica bacterium]|nr:pyrroline-5-carboxylate reductase [Candidatus Omnitrophota bacterium]MBU3933261.1 pyrroline-5-carboxylate reductase [Candidatus Omnitrophota bacterium]